MTTLPKLPGPKFCESLGADCAVVGDPEQGRPPQRSPCRRLADCPLGCVPAHSGTIKTLSNTNGVLF